MPLTKPHKPPCQAVAPITQTPKPSSRACGTLVESDSAAHHTYPPKRNKLNWLASVITGAIYKPPRAEI